MCVNLMCSKECGYLYTYVDMFVTYICHYDRFYQWCTDYMCKHGGQGNLSPVFWKPEKVNPVISILVTITCHFFVENLTQFTLKVPFCWKTFKYWNFDDTLENDISQAKNLPWLVVSCMHTRRLAIELWQHSANNNSFYSKMTWNREWRESALICPTYLATCHKISYTYCTSIRHWPLIGTQFTTIHWQTNWVIL